MSTRWQIVAKMSDGRWGAIYVHCDGYKEHALRTLGKFYDTQDAVESLVGLGDCLSVSGPTFMACESFHRRGEAWSEACPTFSATMEDASNKHMHGDEEFRYVWDGETWACDVVVGNKCCKRVCTLAQYIEAVPP